MPYDYNLRKYITPFGNQMAANVRFFNRVRPRISKAKSSKKKKKK